MKKWKRTKEIMRMETQWVSMHGENWIDEEGKELEYWRVERADSVIILPVYNSSLLLPPPAFRPGVDKRTLDFPGGRLASNCSPEKMVGTILNRELGISNTQITKVAPINNGGWNVDSSFSNQRLWGFVADINDSLDVETLIGGYRSISVNVVGLNKLLSDLTCLQCRAMLLEWIRNTDIKL